MRLSPDTPPSTYARVRALMLMACGMISGCAADPAHPPMFRARGNNGLQVITECGPQPAPNQTRLQIQQIVGSDVSYIPFDGDIEACVTASQKLARELCESLPGGCDKVSGRYALQPRTCGVLCHTPENGCSNQCHGGFTK